MSIRIHTQNEKLPDFLSGHSYFFVEYDYPYEWSLILDDFFNVFGVQMFDREHNRRRWEVTQYAGTHTYFYIRFSELEDALLFKMICPGSA